MILIDTSVWLDYFGKRQKQRTQDAIRVLRRPGAVAICPTILQEVLQGARDEMSFARIRRQLVQLNWREFRDQQLGATRAARIYAALRWIGITVRKPSDCLIASIAVEHGLTLLHDDRDFENIAKVEPRLKLL
ncbi:PIN domain-containing protein [bacterium]|nr:PIN domain-containing protein [bacterium]